MVRLFVFGAVLAGGLAAGVAPAAAQRGRDRPVSPPNALPPVPTLPTYNAPVTPNYNGFAAPGYNGYHGYNNGSYGYNGPVQRQGRVWIPPYYDQYGNLIQGYWR